MLNGQHLLGIEDLDADHINHILEIADGFLDISRREVKKVPILKGRTVIHAFFENSTRTRVSFELASKRLSADAVNVSASSSAMSKGESLLDTVQNIDAMHADAVIIRHQASGAPHFLAKHLKARVINAGDGQHEHPSQALLDLYSMRAAGKTFDNLSVSIIGDITHSRVARSNLLALKKMGAKTRVYGPHTLIPKDLAAVYGCEVAPSLKAALEGADVVMALRLQHERMNSGFLPSLDEYARLYGIDAMRLAWAKPDALLMHPGPVNQGVELSPEVVRGPQSIILSQVEAGVAVRMAILYLILGGEQ